MPLYYVILIILIIIVILSLILNLLTNPIVWIIIAILVVWSAIKRYLYTKQLEDNTKNFKEKTEEKKKAYYSQEEYRRGSDDIIDVDYQEFEKMINNHLHFLSAIKPPARLGVSKSFSGVIMKNLT